MQLFSTRQLAFIRDAELLPDGSVSWSKLNASSVYTVLDARYSPSVSVENWNQVVTGLTVELLHTPVSWFTPQVFVNGLLQGPSHYTIAGTLITFSNALAVDDVQVIYAHT